MIEKPEQLRPDGIAQGDRTRTSFEDFDEVLPWLGQLIACGGEYAVRSAVAVVGEEILEDESDSVGELMIRARYVGLS